MSTAIARAFNDGCGADSSGNAGCTVTTCSCTYTGTHAYASSTSLAPSALLVTLDGVVLDGHGTMSGGAAKGQGASVLAYKREQRELTTLLQELEERFNAWASK